MYMACAENKNEQPYLLFFTLCLQIVLLFYFSLTNNYYKLNKLSDGVTINLEITVCI